MVYALEGNGARPSHMGKGFSGDGTMYTLNTIEQHSVCYSVNCRNLCTLTANDFKDPHIVAYAIENHPCDSRVNMTDDGIVQTLNARMGTGGGNVPMVLMDIEGICTTINVNAVIEERMKVYPRITGALCANSHPGSYTGQDAYNDMLIVMSRDYKDGRDLIQEEKTMEYDSENYTNGRKYVLRRLTPLECLRLQGLPDWWVDDVQGSDSAVYKMAGNGLAIPCACDVLGRIAEEIRSE